MNDQDLCFDFPFLSFLSSILNAFCCHFCSVPKQQKKLEQKLLLSKWGEKDKKSSWWSVLITAAFKPIPPVLSCVSSLMKSNSEKSSVWCFFSVIDWAVLDLTCFGGNGALKIFWFFTFYLQKAPLFFIHIHFSSKSKKNKSCGCCDKVNMMLWKVCILLSFSGFCIMM